MDKEFISTTTSYKIGHVRTPEEVYAARREHDIIGSIIAKELNEIMPRKEAIVHEQAIQPNDQNTELKNDWFTEWPMTSQKLAKLAPSAYGVRRPHDGPWDYYGTRAEGARFHSHFIPIYPLGTYRTIIVRDYAKDCTCDQQYLQICLQLAVDPKINLPLYKRIVAKLAIGLSQTFIENTKEHAMAWGDDIGLDMLIKVLIINSLAHDTINNELLEYYPTLIESIPESEHIPVNRKNLYIIMVDTAMKSFHTY